MEGSCAAGTEGRFPEQPSMLRWYSPGYAVQLCHLTGDQISGCPTLLQVKRCLLRL